MERLSHWIQIEVEKGVLKPIKASWSGPGISHIFFVDDILLFAEARENQVACIKKGLGIFCKASGQLVGFGKSTIFFSLNLTDEIAEELSANMGIFRTRDLGKYLGFHINQEGRNTRAHQMILQKVNKKLSGWKSLCLSRAGRLTLAQLVINTIPIFIMQLEKLLAKVHEELDKAMKNWTKQ